MFFPEKYMVWFVQKSMIKIRIFAPSNLSGPQDFQK